MTTYDDTARDTEAPSAEASEPAAATAVRARRSIGQNVAAMLLSQLVTWTVTTVVTTVQPRFLGPIGLGQLRLAYALWSIVELLAAAGSGTLATIEVAKSPATADDVFRQILRVRLACFVALAPVVAVFLWVAGYDPSTVRLLALLGLASLFNLVTSGAAAVLTGLREMGRVAKVTMLQKIVGSVLVIALLLVGGNVVHLAFLAIALAAGGALISRRAVAGAVDGSPRDPAPATSRLLRAGVGFLVADLVLTSYQQVDTIVMSVLLGRKESGWYAVADQLFGTLLFLPVILTTALFPALVDLHHRDPAEVDRMLVRTTRSFLLLAVPIGCATIVSAEPFVRLLYGAEFDGAARVLQIYGVVIVLTFLTILLGRFAQATGRTGFWSALMAGAIVLSIPLDVVLVPWTDRRFDNGAMGGALSYIVTEGLMLCIGAWVIGRAAITRATFSRAAHCAVGGAAMVAAAWPLRHAPFVVPGLVSLLVYAAVMVVTRTLDGEERRQLARVLASARARARRSPHPVVIAEGAP